MFLPFALPAGVGVRPFAILLGFLSLAIPACQPGPSLVIATTWPADECRALEADFARRVGDPISITWVRLAPGTGPVEVFAHRVPVDLVLGGPVSIYRRLALRGDLAPTDPGGPASWGPARTRVTSARLGGDPRIDPATFSRMKSLLSGPHAWAAGYADLVGRAGTSGLRERDRPSPGEEGAGVALGARNPEAAHAFLKMLVERVPGPHPVPPDDDPAADALLADLLGATLIDAGIELRAARVAIDRAGRPAEWPSDMVQAPPWPPGFIATRLIAERRRHGEDPAPLLETLARTIVPDPDARTWLLASWDRPQRPINGAVLAELAHAAGGTLAREPRFRAWLRSEWREWARQRYRRVGRRAAGTSS